MRLKGPRGYPLCGLRPKYCRKVPRSGQIYLLRPSKFSSDRYHLNSMIRTRETAHPKFGNPRNYKESSWGSDFTPPEMMPYEMNTWEGEYVNFCESSSVETTFEVDTSVCVTTGVYTLETSDVFPDVTLPMSAEELIPEDGKIIENIETVMDDTSAASARAIPFLSLVAIVGVCILW